MKKTEPLASRILLVDDNLLGSCARKMILMDHGYEVETAESGEEAWDIFQTNRFDIVVTDFRMKGMTGLDLIQLIRNSNSPARIILLSGFAGCLGMTEVSTGADEVIEKSNKEVQELLRALKRLTSRPPRRPAGSKTRAAVKTARAV